MEMQTYKNNPKTDIPKNKINTKNTHPKISTERPANNPRPK